jgi:hypothetical protein
MGVFVASLTRRTKVVEFLERACPPHRKRRPKPKKQRKHKPPPRNPRQLASRMKIRAPFFSSGENKDEEVHYVARTKFLPYNDSLWGKDLRYNRKELPPYPKSCQTPDLVFRNSSRWIKSINNRRLHLFHIPLIERGITTNLYPWIWTCTLGQYLGTLIATKYHQSFKLFQHCFKRLSKLGRKRFRLSLLKYCIIDTLLADTNILVRLKGILNRFSLKTYKVFSYIVGVIVKHLRVVDETYQFVYHQCILQHKWLISGRRKAIRVYRQTDTTSVPFKVPDGYQINSLDACIKIVDKAYFGMSLNALLRSYP